MVCRVEILYTSEDPLPEQEQVTQHVIRIRRPYRKDEILRFAAEESLSCQREDSPVRIRNGLLYYLDRGHPCAAPLSRICYIASDRHYTVLKFISGGVRLRCAFSAIRSLPALGTRPFIDCNRGVLLNMDYITSASRDVFCMKDGSVFAIRRRGRRKVLFEYDEYRRSGEMRPQTQTQRRP